MKEMRNEIQSKRGRSTLNRRRPFLLRYEGCSREGSDNGIYKEEDISEGLKTELCGCSIMSKGWSGTEGAEVWTGAKSFADHGL